MKVHHDLISERKGERRGHVTDIQTYDRILGAGKVRKKK